MSDVKRTFIAINLPPGIKKEITARVAAKIPAGKARPVEMENLHITLKFLGYLPPEKMAEVKEKLKALAAVKRFEVELGGVGEFGGRVVWLGVQKGREELAGLSQRLDEALEIKDDRFHAHVTLARNKELKPQELKELLNALERENGRWTFTAESLDLMESVLSSSGPRYSVAFKQALG